MKMKMLGGVCAGMLMLAGSAAGATYTDAATNYPGGWTNGTNGGTGFAPWSIVADGGVGGWAGCGIWNSAGAGLGMGEAFGYVGKVGYVTINRSFLQAMNTNDSFALDFGVNWDSDIGNKGFSLFANGVEVINVNHGGFPGPLTLNGANAITNYGTNTMRWTFTQVASNQIGVAATGRDGVETFATTVTVANGYGYLGSMRFYSSGLAADAPDQRQSYFDNLTLIEEGTPPPEPLSLTFTGGTWNPSALGDYPFELTRSGAVGDEIVLTSSNTNSVTVPAGTNFVTGSNTVTFSATVVSLTAGDATIIASNAASGAWAEYTVRAPVLSFTAGTWDPAVTGEYVYALSRFAGVNDEITLGSTAPGVLTVPPTVSFAPGESTVSFTAVVVSVSGGPATITATDTVSGAWADYNVTPVPPMLTIDGPWDVTALGALEYTLVRTPSVGDTILLRSSDTNVLWVPADLLYGVNSYTSTFPATALANGFATITASNTASGAWAEYNVTVNAPENRFLGPLSYANTNLTVSTPPGFVPATVYGADCALVAGEWVWQVMTNGVDYTVSGITNVVIPTAAPAPARRILRIDLLPI